jgi:hypothetical protein
MDEGRSLRSGEGRWRTGCRKSEVGGQEKIDGRGTKDEGRSQRSEPGEIRCASSWRKFHRLKGGGGGQRQERGKMDDRFARMRGALVKFASLHIFNIINGAGKGLWPTRELKVEDPPFFCRTQ